MEYICEIDFNFLLLLCSTKRPLSLILILILYFSSNGCKSNGCEDEMIDYLCPYCPFSDPAMVIFSACPQFGISIKSSYDERCILLKQHKLSSSPNLIIEKASS